jgi:hypothetical protein
MPKTRAPYAPEFRRQTGAVHRISFGQIVRRRLRANLDQRDATRESRRHETGGSVEAARLLGRVELTARVYISCETPKKAWRAWHAVVG